MMIFGLLAVLSVGMMAFATGGDDTATEEPTPDQPIAEEDEVVVEPPTDGSTPSAQTLLLATDAAGNELPDGNYISDGPVDGENADRNFVITAPADGESNIDIGYNAETTFLVELNTGMASLHASLNSDIAGADPTGVESHQETVLINNVPVLQTVETDVYDSATQMVLNISQEQIGSHVAQIDLTNPEDEIHLEFDPDVIGNIHLITNEVEIDTAEGSTTEVTMYVVETPEEITELSAYQIAQIIAQDGSAGVDTTLVAEVYLGQETVVVDGNEINITAGINALPLFSANTIWASEGSHDGTSPADLTGPDTGGTVGTGGTGGTGGTTGGLTPITDTPTIAPDTAPDEPIDLIIDLINGDPDAIPSLDLTGLEDLSAEEIQELQDLADSLDLGSIPTITDLGGLGGLGL